MSAWAAQMLVPCSCWCMEKVGNGVQMRGGGQGIEGGVLGGRTECLTPVMPWARHNFVQILLQIKRVEPFSLCTNLYAN